MTDYEWTSGGYDSEDWGLGYATGKRESVLLVAESIYCNPVIVRMCDATKEPN